MDNTNDMRTQWLKNASMDYYNRIHSVMLSAVQSGEAEFHDTEVEESFFAMRHTRPKKEVSFIINTTTL